MAWTLTTGKGKGTRYLKAKKNKKWAKGYVGFSNKREAVNARKIIRKLGIKKKMRLIKV